MKAQAQLEAVPVERERARPAVACKKRRLAGARALAEGRLGADRDRRDRTRAVGQRRLARVDAVGGQNAPARVEVHRGPADGAATLVAARCRAAQLVGPAEHARGVGDATLRKQVAGNGAARLDRAAVGQFDRARARLDDAEPVQRPLCAERVERSSAPLAEAEVGALHDGVEAQATVDLRDKGLW